MSNRPVRWMAVSVAVAMFLGSQCPGEASIEQSIKTILAVEGEGKGNKEASAAWAELSKGSASDLPAILEAMDASGPLALNWLRGAVGAIADRELAAGKPLPLAELGEFLLDTSHHPRGASAGFRSDCARRSANRRQAGARNAHGSEYGTAAGGGCPSH